MKQFQKVLVNKPKKSVFDLSHTKLMTIPFGRLIPFFWHEAMPGDTFKMDNEFSISLMPLIAPIKHRVNVYVHHFFVPNRLIMEDWEKFISPDSSNIDDETLIVPQIEIDTDEASISMDDFIGNNNYKFLCQGSLADYLGFPNILEDLRKLLDGNDSIAVDGSSTFHISALPFSAYALIFNEYYRDPITQPEVPILDKDLIYYMETNFVIDDKVKMLIELYGKPFISNWEKDYFTTASPTAQLGDPVMLPLGSKAYVKGQFFVEDGSNLGDNVEIGHDGLHNKGDWLVAHGSGKLPSDFTVLKAKVVKKDGGYESLYADLSEASGTTVEQFRRAIRLQHYKEKLLLFGTRYKDFLLGHFGTNLPDSTAQRPILLGGGKLPIQIGDVLQTSETSNTPLGTPAGIAGAGGLMKGFKFDAEEHGIYMSIIQILPRTQYCQGIPKILTRRNRFDFPMPDFANLGEQEVFNKELFFRPKVTVQKDGSPTVYLDKSNEVFGYQRRYAEMTSIPDSVSQSMTAGLKYWNMARIFENLPVLNGDFKRFEDEVIRCFPYQDPDLQEQIILQVYNRILAARPLPMFPLGI